MFAGHLCFLLYEVHIHSFTHILFFFALVFFVVVAVLRLELSASHLLHKHLLLIF
jgi:hypothetical protein